MIWLMVRGDLPTPAAGPPARGRLVASVDHGPHAPSISIARMAASCGAELNNAMASGINVLGDVHGGAGQQCMELYAWIKAEQDAGAGARRRPSSTGLARYAEEHGKIVGGFGHRWHPVDPRSAPLMAMVEVAAAAGAVKGDYVAIGWAVEAALTARKGKPIPMNIDGATAVIFSELGFAPHGPRPVHPLALGRASSPMPGSRPSRASASRARCPRIHPLYLHRPGRPQARRRPSFRRPRGNGVRHERPDLPPARATSRTGASSTCSACAATPTSPC
jgi:hypothetical protein